MIKLIALDIDGTILKKNKIHQITLEAIDEAQKQGIKVVIATGRNLTSIYQIAKRLGLEKSGLPFIAQNGAQAFTYDLKASATIEYHNKIDNLISEQIFAISRKEKIRLFAYSEQENVAYCNRRIDPFKYFMKIKSKRKKIIFNKNYDKHLPISKFICFGRKEGIEKLRDFVNSQNLSIFEFSYFEKSHGNMEINGPGISKAYGLKYVANKLQLKSNEIIYFGDGDNDLEAIKWAGVGVAMANAKPKVKAQADVVTDLPVELGGVGDYLFKNILNHHKDS